MLLNKHYPSYPLFAPSPSLEELHTWRGGKMNDVNNNEGNLRTGNRMILIRSELWHALGKENTNIYYCDLDDHL